MADIRENDIIEPEDSETSTPGAREPGSAFDATPVAPARPVDDEVTSAEAEVPVPVAMEPAEIDERAQVIEALRKGDGEVQAPQN